MHCIKSSTGTQLTSNTAACLFVHQMRLIVAKNHSTIFIESVLHSFKKAKWLCQINSILTQISLLIMVFRWKEKITVDIEILNSVVLFEFFLYLVHNLVICTWNLIIFSGLSSNCASYTLPFSKNTISCWVKYSLHWRKKTICVNFANPNPV